MVPYSQENELFETFDTQFEIVFWTEPFVLLPRMYPCPFHHPQKVDVIIFQNLSWYEEGGIFLFINFLYF